MQHDYFQKKRLTFLPDPLRPGSVCGENLLPFCCMHRSLIFDMQHDLIPKCIILDTAPPLCPPRVSKGARIRNRYNKVPHLTQDTNGKVTNSQLDTTNESQEVSPFPAGDHKAHINRRAQRHSKHKTEKKHKRY